MGDLIALLVLMLAGRSYRLLRIPSEEHRTGVCILFCSMEPSITAQKAMRATGRAPGASERLFTALMSWNGSVAFTSSANHSGGYVLENNGHSQKSIADRILEKLIKLYRLDPERWKFVDIVFDSDDFLLFSDEGSDHPIVDADTGRIRASLPHPTGIAGTSPASLRAQTIFESEACIVCTGCRWD